MNYVSEALEQKVRALTFLYDCLKNPRLRNRGANIPVAPQELEQWKADLNVASRAETFYWNSRTVELVQSSIEAFPLDEIICSRSLLYCDYGWHYFADRSPFLIEMVTSVGRRAYPLRAVSWYWFQCPEGLMLGATGWCNTLIDHMNQPAGPLGPVLWAAVPDGHPMSAMPNMEIGEHDTVTPIELMKLRSWVVAASTFLRQELLRTETVSLERHARKRLGVPASSNARIQVVQLRRTHTRPSNGEEGATEARDWNFQWTVRGHVRQQWYATLNEHLPIYIHPYIKGPEDKPLKPRTTPIFSVTR